MDKQREKKKFTYAQVKAQAHTHTKQFDVVHCMYLRCCGTRDIYIRHSQYRTIDGAKGYFLNLIYYHSDEYSFAYLKSIGRLSGPTVCIGKLCSNILSSSLYK